MTKSKSPRAQCSIHISSVWLMSDRWFLRQLSPLQLGQEQKIHGDNKKHPLTATARGRFLRKINHTRRSWAEIGTQQSKSRAGNDDVKQILRAGSAWRTHRQHEG